MTVDRWRLYAYSSDGTVITPTSDGITINFGSNGGDGLYEVVPKEELIDGETYTFSAMMQDGTVESTTFTLTFGSNAIIAYATGFRFHILPNWETGVMFGILNRSNAASTVNLRAVKVEKGAFSTLANDTPPNYAEELAKCLRYAFVLHAPYGGCAIGFAANQATVWAVLSTPVPLRATPSIVYSGCDLYPFVGGGSVAISSITVANSGANGVYLGIATTAAVVQYQPYFLRLSGTGRILLTADLG